MKRFLLIVVAVCTLAPAAAIALSASPAGAYCTLNDEYTFWIEAGWGREAGWGDPQCGAFGWAYPYGNNGHYRGIVQDLVTDGSCVSARYADGSYNGIQASSCNSSGIIYNFWDQNGDYAAFMRIERNQGPTTWYLSNGY